MKQDKQDLEKPLITESTSTHSLDIGMIWLAFPISGFLVFGIAAYIIAEVMRNTSDLRYQFVQGPGFAISSIVFHMVIMLTNYINKKPLTHQYHGLFIKENGNLNKSIIILLIFRAIVQTLTQIFIALTFYYAVQAGTSPALMMCITASTGIVTAFIFYFMFNERLSVIQKISIVILFFSVIIICGSNQLSQDVDLEAESLDLMIQRVSILVPILMAFILTFLMAINQTLAKITLNKGYNALTYTADFMLLQSLFFLSFFFYYLSEGIYNSQYLMLMLIQTAILFTGQIFQNLGIKYGKVGINTAICQNASAFQFLLEVLINGRNPMMLELVGLTFCIIGIGMNAFRK